MISNKEKSKCSEKRKLPHTTLSIINFTWNLLRLNPSLCKENLMNTHGIGGLVQAKMQANVTSNLAPSKQIIL
jgi:hypothetical protein